MGETGGTMAGKKPRLLRKEGDEKWASEKKSKYLEKKWGGGGEPDGNLPKK